MLRKLRVAKFKQLTIVRDFFETCLCPPASNISISPNKEGSQVALPNQVKTPLHKIKSGSSNVDSDDGDNGSPSPARWATSFAPCG